ncbi:hypothetical protein ACHAXS_008819 [Conticribra weissflogii]
MRDGNHDHGDDVSESSSCMSPDLLMSDDDEDDPELSKSQSALSMRKSSSDDAEVIETDSGHCYKSPAYSVEPPSDTKFLTMKIQNDKQCGIDSTSRKDSHEVITRDFVGSSKLSEGSKITNVATANNAQILSSNNSTASFLYKDSNSEYQGKHTRSMSRTPVHSNATERITHHSSSLDSSQKDTSSSTHEEEDPNLTIHQLKYENLQSQSTSCIPQKSSLASKPTTTTISKFQSSDSDSDDDDIQTRLAKRRKKKRKLAEMSSSRDHVDLAGGVRPELSKSKDTEIIVNETRKRVDGTKRKETVLHKCLPMDDIIAFKYLGHPDKVQSHTNPTIATDSSKKQSPQSHSKLNNESTMGNTEASHQTPASCKPPSLPPLNEKLEKQAAIDSSTSTSIANLGLRIGKTPCRQESTEIPVTMDVSLEVGANIPIPPSLSGPAVLTESPLKPPTIRLSTKSGTSQNQSANKMQQNIDPIVASIEPTPPNVNWAVQKQCLLVRNVLPSTAEATFRHQDILPRNKVAGFDLDQTLVQWRCSGWPSRPDHYELWNANVINRLRQLHDEEQYKLVIFSNQGGIRGAFQGKTATRIKGIIDWIEKLVCRPLFAVCSTQKNGGYHKGNSGMWHIMKEYCNGGEEVHPHLSFFVGDSDGSGTDSTDLQNQYQQTGVDKMFAENVGLNFYTPNEFFETSNMDKRRSLSILQPPPHLSEQVLNTRAALFGGYLGGPVLLILCGAQGSGKSTFSQRLVDGRTSWRHCNQDSIRNGQPGDRKAVEKAVRTSLKQGKNVVLDRMHLDPTQRAPFLEIGKELNVPVHVAVMIASEDEVHERVVNRINHPGKVEGQNGARIAVSSMAKLVQPSYEEGFQLISFTTSDIATVILQAYQRVPIQNAQEPQPIPPIQKYIRLPNAGKNIFFPMITLGTMAGKRVTTSIVLSAVELGCKAVDTAPTYNNEEEVGAALSSNDHINLTIKIPKRAANAPRARYEVIQSLTKLRRESANVILLHWPCDLIEAGELSSTWKELEAMKKEGICEIIGVSNFSISALQLLLANCEIKPSLNQIERHPLLPQYELMDYCSSQGIIVQAHSPLGRGSPLLLENETILDISKDIGTMTPAQILLSWNLQQGVPIVVKFSTEEHGKEVMALLSAEGCSESTPKLSPSHMKAIHNIKVSSGEKSHRFVAPPFMYRPGAAYSWGDHTPNPL